MGGLYHSSQLWMTTNNPDVARSRYLISTFAPAASIFFLISSASSFVTPSLMVFGAPSTSALASAKPSPGTAPRTSLITAILFEPISFKITSNVLFSSAGAAAAAPPAAGPAATATGAAALTPHFSSSCLTNPAISSTDNPLSCSTNLSVSAILFFLQLPPPKAFGEFKPIAIGSVSFRFVTRPAKTRRNFLRCRFCWRALLFCFRFQQARQCRAWFVQQTNKTRCRRQEQPKQLRLQNFAWRQVRQCFQFRRRKKGAIDKANFERCDLKFGGKSLEDFRDWRHIFFPGNDCGLADQLVADIRKTRVGHGTLEKIIFHHVHFRTRWRKPIPQFAKIANFHVLVIGYEHERRAFQLLGKI